MFGHHHEPAQATVLSTGDVTGNSGYVKIEFVLEVRAPTGQVFRATATHHFISRLTDYYPQVGDVVNVKARTATLLHKIESEDTALALLEFASGALGLLHATTAAYPGYPRRVEISGSCKRLIIMARSPKTPPAAINPDE